MEYPNIISEVQTKPVRRRKKLSSLQDSLSSDQSVERLFEDTAQPATITYRFPNESLQMPYSSQYQSVSQISCQDQKSRSAVASNAQYPSESRILLKQAVKFHNLEQLDQSIRKTIAARLEQLNDCEQDEFTITIVEPQKRGILSEQELKYLKAIKTTVPLGSNFQAEIPEFLGIDYFRTKGNLALRRIQSLKVSTSEHSESIHLVEKQAEMRIIYERQFGKTRTDEQFSLLWRGYRGGDVERYISKNIGWYKHYLDEVDRKRNARLGRLVRKKKKIK